MITQQQRKRGYKLHLGKLLARTDPLARRPRQKVRLRIRLQTLIHNRRAMGDAEKAPRIPGERVGTPVCAMGVHCCEAELDDGVRGEGHGAGGYANELGVGACSFNKLA